tara:strand:+ start:828 stop:2147 length:1320 start_codon:yes stop_codon:yes gene_type:complete
MALVSLLGDAGVQDSIVAEPELDESRIGAALAASLGMALVLVTVSLLTLPLVAWFLEKPGVELPWIAAAVTVALHLSASVPSGLAKRAERFGLISRVRFGGTALASLGAIGLAQVRVDIWPILIWQVTVPAVACLTLWLAMRPRIGRPTRQAAIDQWRFSKGIINFQLLNVFNRNADDVLVGKFWGERSAGHYAFCYRILTLPLGLISDLFSTVCFPRLSRLQDDREAVAIGLGDTMSQVGLLTTPLCLGLALAAPELIGVVFGPAWEPALAPFRVLALLGVLAGPSRLLGLCFLVPRETQAFARYALFATPVIVGSFCVGLPWGITGVAVAYSAALLILFPINVIYGCKVLRASPRPLFLGVLRGISGGALISLPLLAACSGARAFGLGPKWALGLTIGVGALTEVLLLVRLRRRGLVSSADVSDDPELKGEQASGQA